MSFINNIGSIGSGSNWSEVLGLDLDSNQGSPKGTRTLDMAFLPIEEDSPPLSSSSPASSPSPVVFMSQSDTEEYLDTFINEYDGIQKVHSSDEPTAYLSHEFNKENYATFWVDGSTIYFWTSSDIQNARDPKSVSATQLREEFYKHIKADQKSVDELVGLIARRSKEVQSPEPIPAKKASSPIENTSDYKGYEVRNFATKDDADKALKEHKKDNFIALWPKGDDIRWNITIQRPDHFKYLGNSFPRMTQLGQTKEQIAAFIAKTPARKE